ncbi:hypothetical protein Y1Q_0009135 [Alligator mississippiensis]|uniref:Uncharacterized protein n=1 Tax=Alligator mississippiensis TaxID=8496 RepID=A0A151M2D3_ALLMI|nr:hypothetical protein Y1Q_0009135 [Alligator mississippiensis]
MGGKGHKQGILPFTSCPHFVFLPCQHFGTFQEAVYVPFLPYVHSPACILPSPCPSHSAGNRFIQHFLHGPEKGDGVMGHRSTLLSMLSVHPEIQYY